MKKIICYFVKKIGSRRLQPAFNKRNLKVATTICYLLSAICCYALEIKSVSVTDQLGTARANYSHTEKINLNAAVFNDIITDRITFRFEIKDPAGVVRFTHTGNSIPGTIGAGGSSVKYIPITNFFSNSGNYKLVVFANTVMKETSFSVYAPNITPTYPSNYARDLTDKPLVFRWVASGAAKYKIYVAFDAAFFNTLLTYETAIMQFSYPDNPTDTRQKLSAGTVYYWKVEGMDAAGNIVAKTSSPSNFTIKSTAITIAAKDLSVLDIVPTPYQPKVLVSVKNQGGKTENAIPLSLYLNGMLVGTQNIDTISVGETKALGFLTNISGLVVAMASLTFNDDYIKNNTLTKQISIYASVAVSTAPVVSEKAKILGTVMSDGGKKLADAVISFDGPSKGTVLTNYGGEYKLDDLSIGEYKLTASASGYVDAEKIVNVDKLKAFTNVDFKLKAVVVAPLAGADVVGIIKGLVSDENKKGLADIEIVLLKKDKKGFEEYQKMLSDKNGYYKFLDVPDGEYVLSVKNDALPYENVEIPVELKDGKTLIKDIKLVVKGEEEKEANQGWQLQKLWAKLKEFIKDEKILSQLDGYEISGYDTKSDVNKIISELEEDKAKITGAEITAE
ncbi:MAG: carboxypeptidase regulatory-like domain-containing protein [Elusimicrobiota bacterium]|nr:carboxypeptidase regulatory-like domain-containing protein [Elusimicrobiota bacterium]